MGEAPHVPLLHWFAIVRLGSGALSQLTALQLVPLAAAHEPLPLHLSCTHVATLSTHSLPDSWPAGVLVQIPRAPPRLHCLQSPQPEGFVSQQTPSVQ